MKIKNLANTYLILALILGALVPVMLRIATQSINIFEYLMLVTYFSITTSIISLCGI